MPIRNNYLIARLYMVSERLFLPLLGRFVKRPNHLTFIGVGIALLVPIGFYIDPILGLSLMVISGFFDMMDGVMAKAQKKETLFGALLDSSFDRISDLCYLIGFWILFWGTGREIPSAILTFLACLFTFMISYIKARAEGLGCKIKKGFMERGVRAVYLIGWALLIAIFDDFSESILWVGLSIYCLLTLGTVVQRFFETRLRFGEVESL